MLRGTILKWAAQIMDWRLEWETGIYPGEMAAFLGLCEFRGIRSVIESGRGEHAYSTQILGEFSERTDTSVISIDLSPVGGKVFEKRLGRYPRLRCLVGSAFNLLPDAAREAAAPIALLLDGPKARPANNLSFVASRMFGIEVIGHHNCLLTSLWGREFDAVFPGAFHYEDLGLGGLPEWQEFKRWERTWVRGYELDDPAPGVPGRSLRHSSLAMALAGPGSGSKALLFRRGDPRCHPAWLWLKWSFRRKRSSPG